MTAEYVSRRADVDAAIKLGLTAEEYAHICEIQGGEPTYVELAIYSLMWSEHCSYKHSRPILGRFPTSGPRVLQGPGENAGIIDIGDGWAIAMKVESHNHPSAVEPFQGAATGVGGIVRDIFTMGARPIVSCDSLRFGELDEPRQRYLLDGVVGGIAHYGNCLGIPTVGGEIYFEPSYEGNCLVNAMAAGILRTDQIVRAKAAGVGNHVVLIGNKTGRDGIGGASVLASQEFDETLEEKRPSVQVGDPFTEKKLIEACLDPAPRPPGREHAGPRRRRPHQLELRDGEQGPGRPRHPRRPRAAARGRHGALGDHDQREPGAHAEHRRAGEARVGARGVRALGPRLHRHRRGHRLEDAAHLLARRDGRRHPGAPARRRVARRPHAVGQAGVHRRRPGRRDRRRVPAGGRTSARR